MCFFHHDLHRCQSYGLSECIASLLGSLVVQIRREEKAEIRKAEG